MLNLIIVLLSELTAARLENERLNKKCSALALLHYGSPDEPNAAPPHCPTCLCGIGHCPKHPAAIFHPPAACPECASGNAAYSIEGMMAAEKSGEQS